MKRCNIEKILRDERSSLPDMGFINHLKELKSRTEKGDLTALDKFFDLYRFDDNQHETKAFRRSDDSVNARARMEEADAYSEDE